MSDPGTGTRITQVTTVGIPVADQDRAPRVLPWGARIREAHRLPLRSERALDRGGDAAADHASLLARGVDVDAEVTRYPVPMFVLRDPDGNRLVIVELPPRGAGAAR